MAGLRAIDTRTGTHPGNSDPRMTAPDARRKRARPAVMRYTAGRSVQGDSSMASRRHTQATPQQGGCSRGTRVFDELDDVTLAAPAHVASLDQDLPAGAHGTVVGIWQGGRAYEVEFSEPFECLVTVPAEGLRS